MSGRSKITSFACIAAVLLASTHFLTSGNGRGKDLRLDRFDKLTPIYSQGKESAPVWEAVEWGFNIYCFEQDFDQALPEIRRELLGKGWTELPKVHGMFIWKKNDREIRAEEGLTRITQSPTSMRIYYPRDTGRREGFTTVMFSWDTQRTTLSDLVARITGKNPPKTLAEFNSSSRVRP
ncbi:MAG TPA: hypothetical protein VEX38_03675 [Fimbriimonadaceae bacterium]|nr:hypothetical protein [Fimbriimonadaceae bacterium]